MITYNLDLKKPFTIIKTLGPDQYVVEGTAKEYDIAGGYRFGGCPGTWTLRMWDLFTHEQKKSIKWYKRVMGDKRAKKRTDELSAMVIARHSVTK